MRDASPFRTAKPESSRCGLDAVRERMTAWRGWWLESGPLPLGRAIVWRQKRLPHDDVRQPFYFSGYPRRGIKRAYMPAARRMRARLASLPRKAMISGRWGPPMKPMRAVRRAGATSLNLRPLPSM